MERRHNSCIERLITKEFGSFAVRKSRAQDAAASSPGSGPGNCWKIYINREFWEFQLGVCIPAPGLQAAAGWFESRETLKNGEFRSLRGKKTRARPAGTYPQVIHRYFQDLLDRSLGV